MTIKTFSDLFRNVMQLAYVADDIDVACDFLEQTLGTVPCERNYKSSLGGIVHVDGGPAEEWCIDVALVNAGPTNIEVIRPVSGAVDLYRSAIRPDAPATFHHVAVRVESFDEASAAVHASGKTWKQWGHLHDAISFGYVDMTAELGHYLEVMDLKPAGAKRFAALEAASNVGR